MIDLRIGCANCFYFILLQKLEYEWMWNGQKMQRGEEHTKNRTSHGQTFNKLETRAGIDPSPPTFSSQYVQQC